MSAEGIKIKDMIDQMKEFYRQISLLLNTADTLMKKEKWLSVSNTSIYDTSKHIDNPLWWMPTEVFRFYLNPELPKRFCFISILLDDDRYERYEIKEPLVSSGFFEYSTAKELSDDEDYYWYSKVFGILSNTNHLSAEGASFYFEKKKLPADLQDGKFDKVHVFGVPLIGITDEKAVKLKLTDNLLKMLEE